MTASKLKDRINELCTHVLFDYNGKNCGVDPLSSTYFNMWYGDQTMSVDSIEKVMQTPFFDGKPLANISGELKNIEM